MQLKQFILCLSLIGVCYPLFSQEPNREQEVEKIEAGLKWVTGRVVLGNNLAEGNDKVATYGLAALILGGVAAKAGLFKGLIALIIAGKKLIIIAAIAIGGFLARFFASARNPNRNPSPMRLRPVRL